MPYYHVYIDRDGDEAEEMDLSKEQLTKDIARPFSQNKEFMCKGSIINPYDVTTIRIIETNEPSSELLQAATTGAALVGFLGRISTFERLEEKGRDVTREFIRIRAKKRKKTIRKKMPTPLTKNVFIVHGRDYEPVRELKAMVSEFGLDPIVLHEQPSGSRTIVEKLEKYSNVGYAFILLTPDDAGYCQYEKRVLSEDYAKKMLLTLQRLRTLVKKEHELDVAAAMKGFVDVLRGRARQNVVFEFGYFVGLLGRDRVCCLYEGDLELPSDMDGVVYISFKKSVNEVKDKIIKELKAAGYEIKAI
jgi:predicted nucleotide-binding protein